jgi:hypothetical protein
MKKLLVVLPSLLLCSVIATAVQEHRNDVPQTPKDQADELLQASTEMTMKHMDMGPHMKMTHLGDVKPGDKERADEIVRTARQVLEQYKDYKVAEKDGYRIFLPNVPQPMYHFTNYVYAVEAAFRFNPEHPTSLLYKKKTGGYELVGAMYTAPWRETEEDLDKRIPLSIVEWHQHVNFCFPPKDRNAEMFVANPRFGMTGSITTKAACDEAGGRFIPRLFGWMVHVYPFEKNSEDVWSVDRQMPTSDGHTHH